MRSDRVMIALVAFLAAIMIAIFLQVDWQASHPDDTSSEELGQQFFGDEDDPAYSPIMILLAMLLIVALLGAVFLAKEEDRE